jgi:uncharacterized protein YkwD
MTAPITLSVPRRRPRTLALLLATALATIGLALSRAPAAHAATDPATAEAQFLVATNQARAGAGLAPLVRDGALDGVARQWSTHMVTACQTLCHNPDLASVAASIAPTWQHAGENIGVGGTVDAIQQAFLNSPPHYANIVGPYDRVGIGVTISGDQIWVTLDFLGAPPIVGPNGVDQAVPTGSGPAVGTVTALAARARFTPASPQRLLDTRSGGAVPAGETRALAIAGVGQVPGDAVGVVANVTATGESGAGYLTVYPCGATPPTASNVNFTAGSNVPNLVTTALGSGGSLCIYSDVTTDVIVDLAGWYRPSSGSAFTARAPVRVLDTRTAGAPGQSYALPLGGIVSADTVAVSVNLTVTGSGAPGFLAAYPCGGTVPLVSNVNFTAGQTVPNSAVVPLGSNKSICLFSSTPAHVIVDLSGTFGASGTALTTVVPARLLDTRSGTGGWVGVLASGQSISLPVAGVAGVPSTATGVVLNVTVTNAMSDGYLTVYPCGGAVPLASNLNFTAGQTVANLVTVRTGTNGSVCFYSFGRAAVVADITGYLT